jgi:predicted transcriptional regulator
MTTTKAPLPLNRASTVELHCPRITIAMIPAYISIIGAGFASYNMPIIIRLLNAV